jgi:hypothetical protein
MEMLTLALSSHDATNGLREFIELAFGAPLKVDVIINHYVFRVIDRDLAPCTYRNTYLVKQ